VRISFFVFLISLISLAAFLVLTASSSAQAQQDDTADAAAYIKDLCERYTSGNTAPPVSGAEYVPGVDVNGSPVVPADLSGNYTSSGFIDVPKELPINIDLAQRYGLDLPAGIELKPEIGHISLRPNGQAFYGDAEISAAMDKLCKNSGSNTDDAMKKNQSDQEEQHGHESAYPLLSSDKLEGQYPDQ